jgi:adenylate kinase
VTTRLVLLGRQGAGKGTQAANLAAHYDIPHISTGDILRAAATEGTEFGRKAKEYMDAGALVPDDVMIGVVQERLGRDDARTGFLLDGFPRTKGQAEGIDGYVDLVVNLDVPRDVVLARLESRRVCETCGAIYSTNRPPKDDWRCDRDGGPVVQRHDDTTDAINRRLDLYERETAPLVDWYADRGLLVTVDGQGTTEEVADRLHAAIDGRLRS